MGILEKIADIEKEIARTQKNKGTNITKSTQFN
jgi:ribosome-interacting GTPase 1